MDDLRQQDLHQAGRVRGVSLVLWQLPVERIYPQGWVGATCSVTSVTACFYVVTEDPDVHHITEDPDVHHIVVSKSACSPGPAKCIFVAHQNNFPHFHHGENAVHSTMILMVRTIACGHAAIACVIICVLSVDMQCRRVHMQ